MASVKRVGDLEIAHDLPFQRGEWIVQRIGWSVMALLLLAALLGAFGSGPLSDAEATSGELSLEYERVLRFESPHTMSLSVPAGEDGAELLLGREFLERVEIRSVTPEPDTWEWTGDGAVLRFAASGSPVEVSIEYEPGSLGPMTLAVRSGTGESLEATQLVLP